jgi:hypothetical protein
MVVLKVVIEMVVQITQIKIKKHKHRGIEMIERG